MYSSAFVELTLMDKMRDADIMKGLDIGEKILGSLVVMALGLSTCIIVLFAITLVIKLMKYTMSREPRKQTEADLPQIAPVPPVTPQISEPVADNDTELAAVITAAVTQITGDTPFALKNIQAVSERENWSAEGIKDNMTNRNM